MGFGLRKKLGLERFLRGEQNPKGEVLTLDQRRIFILPSKRGLGFGLLILLLMLIAFVYNNNLAYMLAFLLASVFFITILHTYKSMAGLTVQEGQAISVFAGEAAGFGVHIGNPTAIERQHVQVKMKQTVEHIQFASPQ